MNFVVRTAKPEDLGDLFDLARQFALLNLPADKKVISEKIECSVESFAGPGKDDSMYLFVLEDIENKWVVGCSQIKGQNGTKEVPCYSFEILKKERFSKSLGVGFIHQILRLKVNTDGPTEIGGLIVDKAYRQRPERVGRLISLARFLYIGMERERFSEELHVEMAPPLTEEGRSEFWEALGRRFTGMPYQEADALSRQNKEFIHSLFPEEDIYMALLDSKARLALGQVSSETRPALHLLKKIGFSYKNEVDPFDGGPHYGARAQDVTLIQNGKWAKVSDRHVNEYDFQVMIGAKDSSGLFRAGQTACSVKGNEIFLTEKARQVLGVQSGQDVYYTPINTTGG